MSQMWKVMTSLKEKEGLLFWPYIATAGLIAQIVFFKSKAETGEGTK